MHCNFNSQIEIRKVKQNGERHQVNKNNSSQIKEVVKYAGISKIVSLGCNKNE